jgi:hypothetical protein
MGPRRGTSGPASLLFSFDVPVHANRRTSIEEYVASRLHSGLARHCATCSWIAEDRVRIDSPHSLDREVGIIRLHLQRLADVTAHFVPEGLSPS